MNIKKIKVGKRKRKGYYVIVTHNGIFHSDEVLAAAMIAILHLYENIEIMRTRNKRRMQQANIIVDVGEGEFDHHQEGFNQSRPTGELYASAGLVWSKLGIQIVKMITEKELELFLSEKEYQEIANEIDRKYVIPVDLEDNGKNKENHYFSYITAFVPSKYELTSFDRAFEKVVNISREVLYAVIKKEIVKVAIRKELKDNLKNVRDHILKISSQTDPWKEPVVAHNKENYNKVWFVIFPYPDGGWAAQCVPPSLEDEFSQLCPFPESWAGLKGEKLQVVSGVKDAILCHNFRFFARAETEEGIRLLCDRAIEEIIL